MLINYLENMLIIQTSDELLEIFKTISTFEEQAKMVIDSGAPHSKHFINLENFDSGYVPCIGKFIIINDFNGEYTMRDCPKEAEEHAKFIFGELKDAWFKDSLLKLPMN